jgi:HNH endonuclease
MSSGVVSVVSAASFRKSCAALDPELLSGADCLALHDELAAAVKAGQAALLVLSARAIACGAYKQRGFNDGAAWMAHQVGGTTGQARQALETAAGLAGCPGTRLALLEGEPSLGQAAEIVKTESETPGAEAELLEVARHSDLAQLRDKAREHRQANTDVNELHRQQLKARHFRYWRDRLGMVCFQGALPPETGVPFINRLVLAAQRARRDAQQNGGERERFEAYAADALAAMATGEGPARSTRADLVIVCDLLAWRRGHAHPGEVCQVIGGGPVPVELAQELGKDAFLKAVLHDGVAVHTVKHFGRHFPAELRTALDLGPVPAFTGAQCAECGSRFGLEYDHVNPVANQGETSMANVQALCWGDHQAKTERDRQAGLLGPAPP